MSFIDKIFGGSDQKSTSNSGNNAFPWVQSTFGPGSGSAFTAGTSGIQGLLGLGGGDPQAFQKYRNSDGYNFMLDSGSRAITGNMAAKGLLHSGATAKALTQFGQNLGSTQLQSYIGNMSDLAKLGLGGGSLVSGAGQFSTGTGSGSNSSGGLGSFLGSLATAAAMASDRRLKTNITKLREARDGLGVYQWNWKRDPKGAPVIGVIADEVERLRPWAFIPNFIGEFSGVNYSALGSVE